MRFLANERMESAEVVDRAGNFDSGTVGFNDRYTALEVVDRDDVRPFRRSFAVAKSVIEYRDRVLPLEYKSDESENVQNKKRCGKY